MSVIWSRVILISGPPMPASQRDLVAGEEETAQPQDIPQLAGVLPFVRCLELRDLGLDVADERADDRVRRRQGAFRQRRQRLVADADLEERPAQLVLGLVRVE